MSVFKTHKSSSWVIYIDDVFILARFTSTELYPRAFMQNVNKFSYLCFSSLQKQNFLDMMKGPFLLRVIRMMMSMIRAKVGGVFVCFESG